MISPMPVTLEGHGVRLEPLTLDHTQDLIAAAADLLVTTTQVEKVLWSIVPRVPTLGGRPLTPARPIPRRVRG